MCRDLNKEAKIFVYGTLMEGFYNYNKYLRKKTKTIEKAYTSGKLYQQFLESYPSLLKGEDKIFGELIALNNFSQDIKVIDKLEGFLGEGNIKNTYNREIIVATLEDGTEEEAYIYFFNCKDENEFMDSTMYIAHGNWRIYVDETR
ncbi:MAG: gamma-glutamylcyclotransferase family protein [Clostridium sp.]